MVKEIKGGPISAEWGNQIRSYVLHPYTLVKDTRTGYEESDTSSVLDGALNKFIESYLKYISREKKVDHTRGKP
jgi:peptide chain release factor 2